MAGAVQQEEGLAQENENLARQNEALARRVKELEAAAAATPATAPVPAPARGSLAPPDGKPANEAPPAAEFLRLIKEGRVVPDEAAGPYALARGRRSCWRERARSPAAPPSGRC